MPIDWSVAPNTPGLKLKWGDNWIEDYPEDEFAEECSDRPRQVYMYKRDHPRCLIEYTLTVRDRFAFLDFGGRFEKANRRPERNLYIGVTKINFTDRTRSEVISVLWKDKGKSRFLSYEIKASWAKKLAMSISRFNPSKKDRRLRGFLESVLRPDQLRFRALLLKVYSARCSMTGSALVETLEAAHIMPYRGKTYDHIQNGLLLRADLHRLFDRYLISVNPKSRRVCVSRNLKRYAEYMALNGRLLLQPKMRKYRPHILALTHHYKRFRQVVSR